MANSNLIKCLMLVLDNYVAGLISAQQAEDEIEFKMLTLDGIGLNEISSSRSLSRRLVVADASDNELVETERVSDVVFEFRRFFSGLPVDPGA